MTRTTRIQFKNMPIEKTDINEVKFNKVKAIYFYERFISKKPLNSDSYREIFNAINIIVELLRDVTDSTKRRDILHVKKQLLILAEKSERFEELE